MKLDSMNKKNQYKFLYDVLGNSIIVENLIKELKPKNFRVSLEIIAKTILLLFILNQE